MGNAGEHLFSQAPSRSDHDTSTVNTSINSVIHKPMRLGAVKVTKHSNDQKAPRAHLSDPPESFQENGDLCLISERVHLRGCSMGVIWFVFLYETPLAHQQNPFSRWMWELTTRILHLGMAALLSTDSWLTFR